MKKIITLLLSLLLLVSFAGCSNNGGSKDDKVIKVGATLVPHAEILNDIVKEVLAKDGWTLEVVEFNDYVTPNTALEEGSLIANYFQTLGYMNNQNAEGGLHLTAVCGVHIEPMGLYSKKWGKGQIIPNEAVLTIAVPNDTDNYNRAIDFLVFYGFLAGTGTVEELTDNPEKNPHGHKIVPLDAAYLPRSLDDVDMAVINGNYALEAKLPESYPALVVEQFNEETSIRRTNFIVVKQGTENNPKVQALINAIISQEVTDYINNKYKGAVIPSFIDANGKPLKK